LKNAWRAVKYRIIRNFTGNARIKGASSLLAYNGTLYTGVTSHLQKRLQEHRSRMADGFIKKYHVHILVYNEVPETMHAAISREKQIKGGSRNIYCDAKYGSNRKATLFDAFQTT
jgi:putative endonuclease